MNESNRTGTPVKKLRKRPASSAGEWTGGGILILLIICGIAYGRHHFDEKAKKDMELATRKTYLPNLYGDRAVKIRQFGGPFNRPFEDGRSAGIKYAENQEHPPSQAALDWLVEGRMSEYARFDAGMTIAEGAVPADTTPRIEYQALFRQGFQEGYRAATTPAF